MAETIRAIYHDGQLQLLDPVNLSEGQEIQLMIMPNKEKMRAALADLLVEVSELDDDEVDEDDLLNQIAEDFKDLPPLSQTIIEERETGL